MTVNKEPQKESTDFIPLPTESNEYDDSVYAIPAADIQNNANFDNQIPSVNPIKMEDFRNYVTTREISAFQQEYRV